MKNLINHIAFVLDRSGSMSGVLNQVVDVFRKEIEHLKETSKKLNQETRVSVYIFADWVECQYFDTDVSKVSLSDFYACGQTALLDAGTKAIEDLKELPQKYGDHAFLLYILTDGEENHSRKSDFDSFTKLLKSLPNNWTVACMVPNARAVFSAKSQGFPAGNVQVWETTEKGIEEVAHVTRGATMNYMNLRSQGVRSTSSFYQTDLSNVTKTSIKKNLEELKPDEYRLLRVGNNDRVIKDFVESWTKEPYRIGSAYYELVKTEEIQGGKEICIQHRKDGRVYMGRHARDMINLPNYNLKVKPGDHGDWRLFIQSTSVNRKLPHHTQVLVIK